MALSDNIFIVAGILLLAQVAAAAAEEVGNDSNRALLLANRGRGEDHRHGPRAKRTKFDYGRALACIMQDQMTTLALNLSLVMAEASRVFLGCQRLASCEFMTTSKLQEMIFFLPESGLPNFLLCHAILFFLLPWIGCCWP